PIYIGKQPLSLFKMRLPWLKISVSEYAFGLQSSAYCRSDDFWMSDESPSASRLLRLADGLVSDSPEGCDSCFPGG
ncbi:hypothetical protein, partial [uncultured Duncaniella sp.]|uniref:hypothetical protein n=1 Tax=uncultured Duncaniella sp. TaxID=2768039 RepID=UPI0025B01B80